MAQTRKLRGEFWKQDDWGRVCNAALPKEMLSRMVVESAEEAADIALERFGDRLHSVYLSGPAARGRRGGATFFVLLRHGAKFTENELQYRGNWETVAAAQLRRRYPRLERVKVSVLDWTTVFALDDAFSVPRFQLAVNSIGIAGRNMTRMLAPQKLDAAVANRELLDIRSRLQKVVGRLNAAKTSERVELAALDASHAILGAAFALVVEREQLYTEDLDLRRELFLLNHPTRSRSINQVFIMSVRPSDDKAKVLSMIDHASRWLLPMCDAWLNANNPQRAEQLKA